MIQRPLYLKQLSKFRDVPLVKILVGIRWSGKSSLLKLLREELLADGVSAERIIEVCYSSEAWPEGYSDREMYQDLRKRMQEADAQSEGKAEITGEADAWTNADAWPNASAATDGRFYLLLDEV